MQPNGTAFVKNQMLDLAYLIENLGPKAISKFTNLNPQAIDNTKLFISDMPEELCVPDC
jgi:hypothetical protein